MAVVKILDELPWRWSPWWANVLRLGSEVGDQFGLGLLHASDVRPSPPPETLSGSACSS